MSIRDVMSPNGNAGNEEAPSIDVKLLSYAFPDGSSGLQDVILNLPPGSRTLLIGGNSAPCLPYLSIVPSLTFA